MMGGKYVGDELLDGRCMMSPDLSQEKRCTNTAEYEATVMCCEYGFFNTPTGAAKKLRANLCKEHTAELRANYPDDTVSVRSLRPQLADGQLARTRCRRPERLNGPTRAIGI